MLCASFTLFDIIDIDVLFFAARVETDANPADDASRDDFGIVKVFKATWKEPVLPSWIFDVWKPADSVFECK